MVCAILVFGMHSGILVTPVGTEVSLQRGMEAQNCWSDHIGRTTVSLVIPYPV